MTDAQSQPKNRRERRAAAAAGANANKKTSKSSNTATATAEDIPMVKPDYDAKPTGKTLYQIVDERYAEMRKKGTLPPDVNASQNNATGAAADAAADAAGAAGNAEEEVYTEDPIGATANAFIYTISLSMLHITLDVIVLSQYQQEIIWRDLLLRIARMTPGLFFVVWLFHLDDVKRWRRTRQLFFLVTSIVAGCYLIYAGNVYGYYFVMKKAPPVGTLWVWSVVEMDLWYAVVHAVVVLGFMKYKKFRAF